MALPLIAARTVEGPSAPMTASLTASASASSVEVPRTDDEEELAQRALLDENASQDAALAHGEPAAPTLTAAWSKDTLEA